MGVGRGGTEHVCTHCFSWNNASPGVPWRNGHFSNHISPACSQASAALLFCPLALRWHAIVLREPCQEQFNRARELMSLILWKASSFICIQTERRCMCCTAGRGGGFEFTSAERSQKCHFKRQSPAGRLGGSRWRSAVLLHTPSCVWKHWGSLLLQWEPMGTAEPCTL